MKKIFTLLFALTIATTSILAQATPAKPAQPAKKEEAKKATPATPAKPASKTKADGTPDMRFKENKGKATPAKGPLKADGTPDMRYKANQKGGKKKG